MLRELRQRQILYIPPLCNMRSTKKRKNLIETGVKGCSRLAGRGGGAWGDVAQRGQTCKIKKFGGRLGGSVG